MYRLFGWWYRWQACKMAATLCADSEAVALVPRLWSATVFFEKYMTDGADGTVEEFGPKEPADLKFIDEQATS